MPIDPISKEYHSSRDACVRSRMDTFPSVVERSGSRIAYVRHTDADVATRALSSVMFLHGLASNMSRWSEFVANTSLSESRDLIRVDLRGHGESMTRRAFSLETWTSDLVAILAQEKASRAIVVGHSLGAQAALHFGVSHPEKLAGLVLIDPIFREAVLPAKRSVVRNAPLYSAAASVIRFFNRIGIHRGALPPLDLHALDLKAREALATDDPVALEKFVAQYSSTRADLKHIPHANYLQDMVEMFRALPPLSPIACPVLALRSAVAGYQDDAIVEARLREMQRVEIQAIDCHHWPLTERPVEVRTAIEQWIAENIHE
jgi:pimeloyl-ACP methyl ester carboxylesterase